MTPKELLDNIIKMLHKKADEIQLAPAPRPPYNGHMSTPTPEFQADPMNPSPALQRQIAQAIKDGKIDPNSIVASWAEAFLKIYPNE